MSAKNSTSLDDSPKIEFDAVVTMGFGDVCLFVPAKQHIDWQIPDPRDMPPVEFRQVRDLIGGRVKQLIDSLT